jgi:hypothetical protein
VRRNNHLKRLGVVMVYKKKLIEVALPLDAITKAAVREGAPL